MKKLLLLAAALCGVWVSVGCSSGSADDTPSTTPIEVKSKGGAKPGAGAMQAGPTPSPTPIK